MPITDFIESLAKEAVGQYQYGDNAKSIQACVADLFNEATIDSLKRVSKQAANDMSLSWMELSRSQLGHSYGSTSDSDIFVWAVLQKTIHHAKQYQQLTRNRFIQ